MTVRTQTADEQFFDATWAAQEHFTLKAGGQPLDERTWLDGVAAGFGCGRWANAVGAPIR